LPQITRAQKIRLGIFLATGATVLIGGIVILAGLKLGEERDEYDVRFRDADVSLSGLEPGSPVKYSGIQVGRVEAVRIDPDDVSVILVELSLDEGTPVAEDSKANLGVQGITGLKYVELSRGSRNARVREPGEEIPPGTSTLDNLTQKADQIATKVNVVLDRLADLAGPDMKDRIGSLMESTDEFLRTVNTVLRDNREALASLATSVRGTAEQARMLTTELATTAKRANGLLAEATIMLRNSRGTPKQLNAFLEQAAAVLKESRGLLGPDGLQRTVARINTLLGQTHQQLVDTVGMLRETAENASALSERLRDDPSLLLLGGDEEDGN
jgi:phospholipid/cholesterol/gamma-HCH transport system substrate-binding protein